MIAVKTIHSLAQDVLEVLEDLSSAIDVEPSTVRSLERLTSMNLPSFLPSDRFADEFTRDRVRRWFAVLGDDLKIRITSSEDRRVFNLTPNSLTELSELLDVIERTDIGHLSINVDIKKEYIQGQISNLLKAPVNAVIYYSELLEGRMTVKGVKAFFEDNSLANDKHNVICVLSTRGLLQSAFLTVVGVLDPNLASIGEVPSVGPARRVWRNALAIRSTTTTWTASLWDVPPDMFQVREVSPGLEALQTAMLGLSDVLSVLQFCNVVTEQTKQIEATLGQPGASIIKVSTDSLYRDESVAIGTPAFRMFRWAFRSESYDKIDVVRDLLTREIRTSADETMERLIQAAQEILEAARASYKTLRKQAFEAYLRSREEARSKITTFAASERQNLDKLRSDMVARALQFFAAILGYLAVSVLKTDISPHLKFIGVVLGIVYLILIACFQLYPSWDQFHKERAEAIREVNAYVELSPAERSKIIALLPTGNSTEFHTWFWVCAGAYGLGMLALLFALVHYWP